MRLRAAPVPQRAHALHAQPARHAMRCWRPTPRMPPVRLVPRAWRVLRAAMPRAATAMLAGATTVATTATGLRRAWRRALSPIPKIFALTSHPSSRARVPRAWMDARAARRSRRSTLCSRCVAFVRPAHHHAPRPLSAHVPPSLPSQIVSLPQWLSWVLCAVVAATVGDSGCALPPPPMCTACIEVHSNYVSCMSAPATCVSLDVSSFQGGQNTGTIPTAIGTLTALTYL